MLLDLGRSLETHGARCLGERGFACKTGGMFGDFVNDGDAAAPLAVGRREGSLKPVEMAESIGDGRLARCNRGRQDPRRADGGKIAVSATRAKKKKKKESFGKRLSRGQLAFRGVKLNRRLPGVRKLRVPLGGGLRLGRQSVVKVTTMGGNRDAIRLGRILGDPRQRVRTRKGGE